MRKIILILVLLFGITFYGQVKLKNKKNIDELNIQINQLNSNKQESKEQVEALKNEINKSKNSLNLDNKSKFKLPTLVAIYDFKKQIYITDELKPKHKQPVVLKIININKFANTIEIFANDVRVKDDFLNPEEAAVNTILKEDKPVEPIKIPVLNDSGTKVPEDMQKFSDERTKSNKSTIDDLNRIIDNLNSNILSNNNSIVAKKVLIEEYENAKKTVENSTDKIIKYDKTSLELDNEIKQLYTDIDSLKSDIQTKQNTIKIKENQLYDINDNIKNFIYKTNKLAEEYAIICGKQININKINAAYNNYIQFVINPNLTPQHYRDNKLICTITKKDKIYEYYAYVTDFDNNYSEFIKQYNQVFNGNLFYEIVAKDPTYGNLIRLKFDNIKKEVEILYNLVNVSELRKKLNNIEILDKVLSEKEAFTVTSDPIQPLEDYVEFKVKIKQNNILGNSIIAQIPKNFTYIEYAKGGVRWDFSVGTVFDFGIKNQEYEIEEIKTTNTSTNEITNSYKIIENNSSQYTPTIAGMLHTSFRSNSMYAFGFTLGASVDFTKLSLNSFFPGVSLLIGKREKLVFTVGPSFKKVNQIKSIYENNRILLSTIPIENITSEQFKIGWFFGMSYNLTSKQRGKFKLN